MNVKTKPATTPVRSRLTTRQIEHVIHRAREIFHTKMHQELAALGKQPEVPKLTHAQRLTHILNGTAKLNKPELKKLIERASRSRYEGEYAYLTVVEHFIFPEPAGIAATRKAAKEWADKTQAIHTKYDKLRAAFIDKVELSGTGEEVLAMLQELENK